jgi:hypothetical protein
MINTTNLSVEPDQAHPYPAAVWGSVRTLMMLTGKSSRSVVHFLASGTPSHFSGCPEVLQLTIQPMN